MGTLTRPTLDLSTAELAERIGARLVGPGDLRIRRIDALHHADEHTLSFVRSARQLDAWRQSPAPAALVPDELLAERPDDLPGKEGAAVLAVNDPDLAMVPILQSLLPQQSPEPGVHPHASVDPSAQVHPSASVDAGASIGPRAIVDAESRIGPGAVIGADVTIAQRCTIHANAVVQHRSELGDDVVLHPGVVIGADGFGYRPDPGGKGIVKIPHVGNVVIGGAVEIGANTTIDRGKFGSTRIGAGTKIDNLVQIGHNCEIGRFCIICGCCALAGSVTLGDGATLAGGVGIADGRTIGQGATVGARSGVMDDVPPGETWIGYPARPVRTTMRIVAATEQLPDTLKKVRRYLASLDG